MISFCTYNQCNGGTQPNLTFSAVFISILLAFAGSHLWQKHICWKIHFVEIIYRTRIWYLLNLDTKVPQSIQASVYTLPPLPPPQTAMPNWMDHFSKRGFPKVFEQKTFFVKRWSQWWVWDDQSGMLGGWQGGPPQDRLSVQCVSGTRPPETLAMSYEGRRCFSAAKAPPEEGSQAVVVVGRNFGIEVVGC